jgi:hypothetical protein
MRKLTQVQPLKIELVLRMAFYQGLPYEKPKTLLTPYSKTNPLNRRKKKSETICNLELITRVRMPTIWSARNPNINRLITPNDSMTDSSLVPIAGLYPSPTQ